MTEYTWGVYLRPDSVTCKAIADLTELCKRQFGIVSAAAFAPHATLVGAVPSKATADDFVRVLDPLLSSARQFPVFNAGIDALGSVIVYDIDRLADGGKNRPLQQLAVQIAESISPITDYLPDDWTKPLDPNTFHAHFSLASHDLRRRHDLRTEVEAFLRGIPMPYTTEFMAEWITLFRFHSADWNGEWWHDLSWEHIRSWQLQPSS